MCLDKRRFRHLFAMQLPCWMIPAMTRRQLLSGRGWRLIDHFGPDWINIRVVEHFRLVGRNYCRVSKPAAMKLQVKGSIVNFDQEDCGVCNMPANMFERAKGRFAFVLSCLWSNPSINAVGVTPNALAEILHFTSLTSG